METLQRRPHRRILALGRQLLGTNLRLAPGPVESAPAAVPFSVEPITPSFGAEVFGFDFQKIVAGDQALLLQVDQLFMKHKVLMFRDAGLDRETHLKFMGRLVHHWGLDDPSKLGPNGTEAPQARQILGPHGCVKDPFLPQIKGAEEVWPVDYAAGPWSRVDQGVIEVVNDLRSGEKGTFAGRANLGSAPGAKPRGVPGAANSWHSDQMFFQQPSAVTSIRAVRLPALGGDTMFANMEAAYEDLDEALKARLDNCMAANNSPLLKNFERYAKRTGDTKYYDWLKSNFPPTNTPVVRIHPVTKKKALYVNKGYTAMIEGPGVEAAESKALVRRLTDLAKVPEYQARFRWGKVGDLLMWDNRSVVHYALGDYGGESGPKERWTDHVATLGNTPIPG